MVFQLSSKSSSYLPVIFYQLVFLGKHIFFTKKLNSASPHKGATLVFPLFGPKPFQI